MSAAARPRSGGGRRSVARRACGRTAADASRPRSPAAANGSPAVPGRRPASGPAGPAVESHHDDVVWVGPAGRPAVAGSPGSPGSPGASGGASASGPGTDGSAPRARAARRARAWYSGPCLRGSAYSFGLSVQYVPLVVPYQLAPPQSGSNGPCRPRRTTSTRASPCWAARGLPAGWRRAGRPRVGARLVGSPPAGTRRRPAGAPGRSRATGPAAAPLARRRRSAGRAVRAGRPTLPGRAGASRARGSRRCVPCPTPVARRSRLVGLGVPWPSRRRRRPPSRARRAGPASCS